MDTVISYIRFSSPKQEQGDSLRRQTALTAAWAKSNGYHLDDTLSIQDLGVSAYKGKHTTPEYGLGAFLKAVELGRVAKGSILAIERLDRLSRQDIDTAYELFRKILKSGIRIATVANNNLYDESSLQNIGQLFIALVEFSTANQESQKKSERIKASWEQKRKNIASKPITAWCPAWLKISADKTHFEVIQEHLETVRYIFNAYASGEGVIKIVKHLNDIKAPLVVRHTKRATGITTWQTGTVQHILWNKAVIGHFQPCKRGVGREVVPVGEVITNYYPQIVDDETFFKCKARMDALPPKRGRRSGTVSNLFTGKLFCGYCGRRMDVFYTYSARLIKPVRTLKCVNAGNGSCFSVGWRADEFEKEFIDFAVLIKDKINQNNDSAVLAESIATIKATIADSQMRLDRFVDMISEGAKLPDAIISKMNALESDIQAAKEELRKKENQTVVKRELLDDVTINLNLSDEQTRQKVSDAIQTTFDKIDLYFAGENKYAAKVFADISNLAKSGQRRAGKSAVDFRNKWKIEEKRFFIATVNNATGERFTYPRLDTEGSNLDFVDLYEKYKKSAIPNRDAIIADIKAGMGVKEVCKKHKITLPTHRMFAKFHNL